jgi:hypothetical protein
MRGLAAIPGIKELQNAYNLLQSRTPPQEIDLALFSQWARLDPRLAEIWVLAVTRHWQSLNPIQLRSALLAQPWPNTAGVLLEFSSQVVSQELRSLFRSWSRIISHGMPKSRGEQFYIGQRAVGGQEMFMDAMFSLTEYKNWGYLARDVPINKAKPAMFHRDRETRQQVLNALLENSPRLTTAQYCAALGGSISKRQAERDLASCPRLKAIGNTKARMYVLRKAR